MDIEKTCTRCGVTKFVTLFYPTQSWCKDCLKQYQKDRYQARKEQQREAERAIAERLQGRKVASSQNQYTQEELEAIFLDPNS